jgi:hypothetical protein
VVRDRYTDKLKRARQYLGHRNINNTILFKIGAGKTRQQAGKDFPGTYLGPYFKYKKNRNGKPRGAPAADKLRMHVSLGLMEYIIDIETRPFFILFMYTNEANLHIETVL